MPDTLSHKHRIEDLSRFISQVNQRAYRDPYLISNQILSKNPFVGDLFEKYLYKRGPIWLTGYRIMVKLARYYLRSYAYLLILLANKLVWFFSKQRYHVEVEQGFTIIDSFWTLSALKNIGISRDHCFPGFDEFLSKRGKRFAHLPVFSKTPRPIELYHTLCQLRDVKKPVLMEFQLLGVREFLLLLRFCTFYPFHVILFLRSLRTSIYEECLLKSEMLNTLHLPTALNYSRYLQGRKISSLKAARIVVISWYENQVIDKNLYLGLRKGDSRVRIIGSQCFIYPTSITNISVDPEEIKFGIVPDKILVNGPYYLYPHSTLECLVGPSIRYKKLFNFKHCEQQRNNLLVLLPYYEYEIVNILSILKKLYWKEGRILVKFHPTTDTQKYTRIIPSGVHVVNNDVYELFQTAACVISAESGTLVEAAALGIFAVNIINPYRFTHNPMVEHGRGVIWENANNADEINLVFKKFKHLKEVKPLAIQEVADWYRKNLFCEVTYKNIIDAYEL